MVSTPLLGGLNSLGGLFLGYIAVGVSTGAGIWFPCWFDLVDNELSTTLKISVVMAIVNAGAFAGAMSAGPFIDKFGSKKGIALAGIIGTAGHVASCFGSHYILQVVGRAVTGIGIGISTVGCPAYVAEMAPDKVRGFLNALFQVMVTVGIFIADLVAYFAAGSHRNAESTTCNTKAEVYCTRNFDQAYMHPSTWIEHAGHQTLLLFMPAIIIPVGLVVIALVIPESKKFLAKKSLETTPLTKGVVNEAAEHPKQERIGSLFTTHIKAATIALVATTVLQFTGINAVFFYSTLFFSNAGITEVLLASTLLGLWNAVTTLGALFLADKLGRRILMVTSVFVLSVAILGLGIVTPTGKTAKVICPNMVPGIPAAITPTHITPTSGGLWNFDSLPYNYYAATLATSRAIQESNEEIQRVVQQTAPRSSGDFPLLPQQPREYLFKGTAANDAHEIITASIVRSVSDTHVLPTIKPPPHPPVHHPPTPVPPVPSSPPVHPPAHPSVHPAQPGPPPPPSAPHMPSSPSVGPSSVPVGPPPSGKKTSGVKSALSMIFLAIYILGFEMGPGSLFWVLINEVFPASIATTSATLFNALNWTEMLIITFGFPPLHKKIGVVTLYLFGGVGILGGIFLLFCMPETAGKTAEEIESEMRSGWVVWPASKVKKQEPEPLYN